jgi:hypothetical protein
MSPVQIRSPTLKNGSGDRWGLFFFRSSREVDESPRGCAGWRLSGISRRIPLSVPTGIDRRFKRFQSGDMAQVHNGIAVEDRFGRFGDADEDRAAARHA